MLELPHAVVGATLAIKIGNPFLSLPLAFLSHFLVDLLPHWNPSIYREKNKYGQVSSRSKKIILIDGLAAFSVGTFLALRFYPDLSRVIIVLAACFLAVLPDLVEVPYFFTNSLTTKNKYFLAYIRFHRRFQVDTPFWLGILTQVFIIILCFFLIFA